MPPGPLLDSLTSSRTSSHSNLSTTRPRPAIPIIPIIPRKLEKKRRQSPREATLIIPNSSEIEEPNEWKADTPPLQDAVRSEEGGVDLNHEPRAQESESPYLKLPEHYGGAERFAFDLPPFPYPHKQIPHVPSPYLSAISNGPPESAPTPIHPRSRTNSRIVFGGFSESATPSPVLVPAIPSTYYTHAPLPVDSSQSVYHGYGHTSQIHETSYGWPGYGPYPRPYGYHMHTPYDNRLPFMHPPDHPAPYTPSLPALSDMLQRQHLSDERPVTIPSVASPLSNEPPPHVLAYPENGNFFAAPQGRDEGHYGYVHSTAQVPVGAAPIQMHDVSIRSMERDLNDDVASDHPRLSTLADYLLDHFNKPNFSDCRLQIVNTCNTFDILDLSLHSLLVARNPQISEQLDATKPSVDGRKSLRIDISDRFVTTTALEAALRVYYGGPLMRQDKFGEGEQNMIFQRNGDLPRYHTPPPALDHALAYAAAGCLLQMPLVAQRGIQIASSLLSWETIEKTISFALEGGIITAWPEAQQETENETSPSNSLSTDSSKDHSPIITPTSTDETHDRETLSHPSLSTPENGTYAPYTTHLLRAILDFLVQNVPPGFILDVTAPPLTLIDRLPFVPKPPPTSTKSRLSSIQFGDYSARGPAAPDTRTTTTLSSVLLSIPFGLLTHIVDALDEDLRREMLRPLIGERERRRRDVSGDGADAEKPACEELEWEEYVADGEEVDGAGEKTEAKMERRW
ncbi:MAG: hypothetical protein LQ347_006917, partial [Umbilicaria vellea]